MKAGLAALLGLAAVGIFLSVATATAALAFEQPLYGTASILFGCLAVASAAMFFFFAVEERDRD